MTNLIIAGFLVLIVAIAMTMVGKGGGNFYVVVLAMANVPMHEAATTGQFILFSASIAAMMIFQASRDCGNRLLITAGWELKQITTLIRLLFAGIRRLNCI